MTPMLSIFTLDQIWLLISYHLSKVSFICWFYFWQISPPPLKICFKRCFKSLFSPLQCIKQSRSAKNVVFFPFCVLVDMSMGGGGYSPPAPSPWLRYCTKLSSYLKNIFIEIKINKKSLKQECPNFLKSCPHWLNCSCRNWTNGPNQTNIIGVVGEVPPQEKVFARFWYYFCRNFRCNSNARKDN